MATREAKKAETRRRLIDAAATLVAKEGAMAASLDAIAEKAGLTKGAVYSNFASKEELLFEVAGLAGPEINATPWPGEPIADYLERLGETIARANQLVSARAWRLGFELTYLAIRNPRFRKLMAANGRRNRKQVAELLDAHVASTGETPSLSGEELFTVVNALASGLSEARRVDPSTVPDDLYPRALRLLAG